MVLTGLSFSLYQNKNKVNKNIVDNIFFSSKYDYIIGGHLFYVKIWPSKFKKKFVNRLKIRNISACSVFSLLNTEIDNLIAELNKKKVEISFVGYALAL